VSAGDSREVWVVMRVNPANNERLPIWIADSPDQGDRPVPRRDQLPQPVLGGAGSVPGRCTRVGTERPGVSQVVQMKVARQQRADELTKDRIN
jgi:hypothetical protein